MKREIFVFDTNSKRMKWLSDYYVRLSMAPIVDAIILLLVVPSLLYLINDKGILHLYLGSNIIIYIWLVIAYVLFNIIIGFYGMMKINSLMNRIIVKDGKVITVIKGFYVGNDISLDYVNLILDERNISYKYTDYKNCKLVKDTSKYREYIGEVNGVSSKVRISKDFINIVNKGEKD